ncbi:hypothetical protein [Bradyrhizobium sp. dw_411]|uniref:2-amino-5-chloromuconate deaminase CnbZ n=1 Tax=Bradyrhizobium sp. dw_411 TaxID=2720082 RepID=UPI001BCA6E3F|nr:hypothetical protein [Bradyrhizobium sp. dw_411]
MTDLNSLSAGSYHFIPGVFQYSAGVRADDGFEIVRARFRKMLPMSEAFAAIEAHLRARNRLPAAFCACELRSPAPFTEEGFKSFNKEYVGWLQRWDLIKHGVNPVARTNVCPQVAPPKAVGIYAFSYTMPKTSSAPGGFVVAGSGEAPEGKSNYRDHAIRLGDRSADGLAEKARWVLGEMERRMKALGATWSDSTGTHLYTIYDIHPLIEREIAARGASQMGLSWHFARPPVEDLDYEMDVRGVSSEIVI